jgi:hypothetical protein
MRNVVYAMVLTLGALQLVSGHIKSAREHCCPQIGAYKCFCTCHIDSAAWKQCLQAVTEHVHTLAILRSVDSLMRTCVLKQVMHYTTPHMHTLSTCAAEKVRGVANLPIGFVPVLAAAGHRTVLRRRSGELYHAWSSTRSYAADGA